MGFWDLLTGKKYPAKGVPRQPVSALRDSLLSINRDTAPYLVRDGALEGVDIVAEWKIVDAQWYEVFAKAGIERLFKVLMRFDETKAEVRAVDQEWSVEWRAGIPTMALTAQAIATTFIMIVTFPRFIAGFKIARTRLSSWDLQAIATAGDKASPWERTARATSIRC